MVALHFICHPRMSNMDCILLCPHCPMKVHPQPQFQTFCGRIQNWQEKLEVSPLFTVLQVLRYACIHWHMWRQLFIYNMTHYAMGIPCSESQWPIYWYSEMKLAAEPFRFSIVWFIPPPMVGSYAICEGTQLLSIAQFLSRNKIWKHKPSCSRLQAGLTLQTNSVFLQMD